MPQTFNLYLGTDLWDSVNFTDSSTHVVKEIIHVPQKTYVHVCLAKTSQRVPFISAIELRPLDNAAYGSKVGSLALYGRYDTGSSHDYRNLSSNKLIREIAHSIQSLTMIQSL